MLSAPNTFLTKQRNYIVSASSSSTMLQTINYEQTQEFDVVLSSWIWYREESLQICYTLYSVNEGLLNFFLSELQLDFVRIHPLTKYNIAYKYS